MMLRRSSRKRSVPAGRGDYVAPAAKRAVTVPNRNITGASVTTSNQPPTYEIIYTRAGSQPTAVTVSSVSQVPATMHAAPVPQSVSVADSMLSPYAMSPTYVPLASINPPATTANTSSVQEGNDIHVPLHTITLTSKASDDLCRNVPIAVKQKIVSGEYIDLASLLTNTQGSSIDKHKIIVSQGELLIQPNQQQLKITNISSWTNAFLVFISIYCTAHPHKFQDLLKYMSSIRLGAKRSAVGWKLYDEQFRLRMSQDPANSWAVVDQELWLFYMFSPPTVGGPSVVTGGYKCYSFNYHGRCFNQTCSYSHSCLRCFGPHPLIQCPRQNIVPNRAGGNVRFQQPQFRPRFGNRANVGSWQNQHRQRLQTVSAGPQYNVYH